MKSNISFLFLLWFYNCAIAIPQPQNDHCNCADDVYSILKKIHTASSFCSSLLQYVTETRTKTVKEKGIGCSTDTLTTTSIYSIPLDFATTTLPTITLTEYLSTKLVPSGTLVRVNKRGAAAQPGATPHDLSQCSSHDIKEGCRKFVPAPLPTTITATSTHFTCTITSTATETQDVDGLPDPRFTLSVEPPPIIDVLTRTATETVPAACATTPWNSGGYVGVGNIVTPVQYPYFAQTGVECCKVCWGTKNCIASAFIDSALDCQLLLNDNGTYSGANAICPKGIVDYPFGVQGGEDANVYPGPCGV